MLSILWDFLTTPLGEASLRFDGLLAAMDSVGNISSRAVSSISDADASAESQADPQVLE